jgi:hypothetical protein
MRRLPDIILFSSITPSGISTRSPWFATIITVPYKIVRRKGIELEGKG